MAIINQITESPPKNRLDNINDLINMYTYFSKIGKRGAKEFLKFD